MEYCGGGSVTDLINAADLPIDEDIVAYICGQILAGLAYLHSIGKVPSAALTLVMSVHAIKRANPPTWHRARWVSGLTTILVCYDGVCRLPLMLMWLRQAPS